VASCHRRRGILAQINRQPAGFPLVNYYGAQICATGSVEYSSSMYRRPRTARPEQQIQRAVFQHLALRAASTVFAFRPANGGWRSRVEAAILKGMGVRAGVPDIIIVKSGHRYALELKERGGRLTPVQRDAHAALVAARATVEVAYGLDDALARLEAWGLVRGSCQGLRP